MNDDQGQPSPSPHSAKDNKNGEEGGVKRHTKRLKQQQQKENQHGSKGT
jgi:hypothetical protein